MARTLNESNQQYAIYRSDTSTIGLQLDFFYLQLYLPMTMRKLLTWSSVRRYRMYTECAFLSLCSSIMQITQACWRHIQPLVNIIRLSDSFSLNSLGASHILRQFASFQIGLFTKMNCSASGSGLFEVVSVPP